MKVKKANHPQLISIQLLRAIAAISVVVGHAITEIHQAGANYPELAINFGVGVDIFFVVSGFVMALTGEKLAGQPRAAQEFMKRRVIRVAPLYWLYSVAMLMAIWLFPSQLNHSSTSLPQVICSFLFLPCVGEHNGYHPVLALGWTLNYEMFFYLLFAVSLAFRPANAWVMRLWGLILGTLIAATVVGGPFQFWGKPIVLEFLAGVIMALLFKKIGTLRSATGFILTIISTGLIYFFVTEGNENRLIFLGLPAILFTAGFIFTMPQSWEERGAGIARFLGDSSYSLYLCHPFALALVKVTWNQLDPSNTHPTSYLIVAVVTSVIMARFSYVWLEKPVTQWLLMRLHPERSPA